MGILPNDGRNDNHSLKCASKYNSSLKTNILLMCCPQVRFRALNECKMMTLPLIYNKNNIGTLFWKKKKKILA